MRREKYVGRHTEINDKIAGRVFHKMVAGDLVLAIMVLTPRTKRICQSKEQRGRYRKRGVNLIPESFS